jgi:hypothetical protein
MKSSEARNASSECRVFSAVITGPTVLQGRRADLPDRIRAYFGDPSWACCADCSIRAWNAEPALKRANGELNGGDRKPKGLGSAPQMLVLRECGEDREFVKADVVQLHEPKLRERRVRARIKDTAVLRGS